MSTEKIGQTEFDPRESFYEDDQPTTQCMIGNDVDNCKMLQIRLDTEDHALAVRRARGIIGRWQGGPNALVPVVDLKDLESKT